MSDSGGISDPPPLLERLGLGTRAQRAWAAYDWANSAMVTIVITAVYPVFFASHAAAGLPPGAATFRHGIATTIALAVIAVIAPFLGALADRTGSKKHFLGTFLGIGATAVAVREEVEHTDGRCAAVLSARGNSGANGRFVFYDALLLPGARPAELARVSTAGYALGYVGGGLLLAACLAMILHPGVFGLPAGDGLSPAEASLPTRITFVAVALWWVGFSIPLFRRVPEPAAAGGGRTAGVREACRTAPASLRSTLAELRRYRQAFLMLLAFLLYNDGIGTIVRMAAIYGREIGIDRGAIIGAILMVQFIGVPFAFLFGAFAARVGTRPAILAGLGVYALIALLGYVMTTATHFYLLAALVGMVQGGTQALSRSLFGSLIPRQASGEFFGLFAVFEKFAGIFGPGLFALAIAHTGSSRAAILSVVVFFIAGAAILASVDVEAGRRVARAAEADGNGTTG